MLFEAVLATLLLGGGHANAQSASQGDYDVDDDRLLEISNLEQAVGGTVVVLAGRKRP